MIVLITIALAMLVSGCTGQVSSTITPVPSDIPVPVTPTPLPGPSMLFNMDNITWYQYFVNVPMEDHPRHLKLNVTYDNTLYNYSRFDNPYDRLIKRTLIKETWLNEENRTQISYVERLADGYVIKAGSGSGMISGRVFGGLEIPVDNGSFFHKRLDISTMFDADRDSTLRFVGNDIARYGGEPYNCTVYDMTAENDTFRVWNNKTFPLPLKIVASYSEPNMYIEHPSRLNVTGLCTYELIGWG